ncbi:hypothetical protein C8R43DRAFT_901562 [Mycena crocata]|nr:hypothetical protein C8R43DRAFT_901562 [Mycena crocata]
MEDIMSIFLVENQRFKVHRHFLVQESDVFKWMFICPPGSGEPDGSTDERPILLPGVTAMEFETLLDFFYTEKFQRHDALMEEWIELLAISTRFDFQRLRECAIDAIDHSRWRMQRPWNRRISIDPIEQIILAEKHDIPHWLPTAYALMCERSHPLEEWEAEKIGYRKTTLLARAREAVRNPQHNPPEPEPAMDTPQVEPAVVLDTVQSLTPGSPSNGFYHNRSRVNAIVSEVFFPPATPVWESI